MKLFSLKTLLGILNQVLINLSSGWIGVVVISPGFFGVSSMGQFFELLIKHLPFGILGIIFAAILAERIK